MTAGRRLRVSRTLFEYQQLPRPTRRVLAEWRDEHATYNFAGRVYGETSDVARILREDVVEGENFDECERPCVEQNYRRTRAINLDAI